MRYEDTIKDFPNEKKVSIFKLNDRESPKGQRKLGENQTSYVLRNKYPCKNDTGYFMLLFRDLYYELEKENVILVEVREVNYSVVIGRIWTRFVGLIGLKQLGVYGSRGDCYQLKHNIKEKNLQKDYPYIEIYEKINWKNRHKKSTWPYSKSMIIRVDYNDSIYPYIAWQYIYERENDKEKFTPLQLYALHKEQEVDERGPGLRLYKKNDALEKLEAKAMVNAYWHEEAMIELIFARCEEEVEIRVNEKLYAIDKLIEKIQKALDIYNWKLEVQL